MIQITLHIGTDYIFLQTRESLWQKFPLAKSREFFATAIKNIDRMEKEKGKKIQYYIFITSFLEGEKATEDEIVNIIEEGREHDRTPYP